MATVIRHSLAPDDSQRLLLVAAFGERERAAAAWSDWRSTRTVQDDYAGCFSLLSVVAANLDAATLEADAGVLQGLARRALVTNVRSAATLSDVRQQASHLGIATAAVRGSAFLSGESLAGLRPIQRLDLWVGRDDVDRLAADLRASGWTRFPSRRGRRATLVRLSHPESGTLVLDWGLDFPVLRTRPRPAGPAGEGPGLGMLLMMLDQLGAGAAGDWTWGLDAARASSQSTHSDGFWEQVALTTDDLGLSPVMADLAGILRDAALVDASDSVLARMREQRADSLAVSRLAVLARSRSLRPWNAPAAWAQREWRLAIG